jgi:NIPSNAP
LIRLAITILCFGMAIVSTNCVQAADLDKRVYEMRVYYAAEGKLDALHARFRNHTCKLFEKHGMQNIGYWSPVENPERKLIYFLAYPDRESREKSWKNFMADPEWQAAYKASEVDGKLVAKVDMLFLQATDYSPQIKAEDAGKKRVFELRTYTASPGNLEELHSRFRDHTCKLFEKHGMRNVAYWSPMKGQAGEDNTLIYIISHESPEAAAASFGAFRQDPDWIAARSASEQKAGGSLTVKEGGVKSVFMQATDYSQIK